MITITVRDDKRGEKTYGLIDLDQNMIVARLIVLAIWEMDMEDTKRLELAQKLQTMSPNQFRREMEQSSGR